ncbi:MAG: DUF58 domain-containing protein [Gemmataceae bacterium]|nr:DUF58 domain-containing protein [Gemmataceae bacterium]
MSREGLFWLLIAVAMLVTGLIKAINLLNLLACWLLALLAWNAWLARRHLRRVEAKRSVPELAFAATPFEWSVSAANTSRRPVGGFTLRDDFGGADGGPMSWFVDELRPGQTVTLTAETTLSRRGVYRWRQVTLASGYPAGLAHVRRECPLTNELLVAPRLGQLQRTALRHWLNQRWASQGRLRSSAHRQPTAQLEFHGLRSFRSGDSPRHIHWRTTARCGELMVREFEDMPNDDLVLIVDPRLPSRPATDGAADRQASAAELREHFELREHLLSLAATICWEWCRQKGDELALGLLTAPPVWRRGVTGRDLAYTLLKDLALVPADDGDADWETLLALMPPTAVPDAAILVVTLRNDAPLDDLAALRRRPATVVNVARGEEQAFFTSAAPRNNRDHRQPAPLTPRVLTRP